ncbi:MAG TPA: NAD(P)-dependent oxidoreductase [Roseiflexaceae bacterium]|nr:NAD(P)-dependent oxidoreductase [Roseiflexaceae bacterium]HMP40539.1 NAD(P)-dependent oxidoreductase [Roseiflexaceae bacterium]
MKIAVTGGAGHIGRAVVAELVTHGFQVVVGDRQHTPLAAPLQLIDFEDLGQTISLLDGCDAVVHTAAVPRPGGLPDHVLFRSNMTTLFNVLEACRLLGIRRFIWTSSMSVLGMPFNYRPITPDYLPFDEQHRHDAQDPYALSKSLGEQLVAAYAARCDLIAFSLRVVWAHTPATFARDLRPFWDAPAGGAANLWSYVDTRDCGQAVRLALQCRVPAGHYPCFISAADTCMPIATRRLLAEHLPHAPSPAATLAEYGSLFDISRARSLLGYEPQYHWRDY